MAVHKREEYMRLYGDGNIAWFSLSYDPDSVWSYQSNERSTRHSCWVLSSKEFEEILANQKLARLNDLCVIEDMIRYAKWCTWYTTHDLVKLVKDRWGTAALRRSLCIHTPMSDNVAHDQPVTTMSVRRFESVRVAEAFVRRYMKDLLVKFPAHGGIIADQGLSWSRALKRLGYDGWIYESFAVARLLPKSDGEFELDFTAGECLLDISGPEFDRFRAWLRTPQRRKF